MAAPSLARFFQYLSNTDQDAIKSPLCSKYVRMVQTSLGVMVFITGAFAFLSSTFAINTAFDNVPLAILVGSFWGLMIIWFDRAIVSARDKRAVLIRLPIALAIGFSVSIPLEIKLLQDRLDKYLTQQSQVENKEVIDRRNLLLDESRKSRAELEQDVKKYRNEVNRWSDAMEAEVVGRVKEGRTGKSGEGPAYREANRNKELNERLLNDTLAQLRELEIRGREEREIIDKDYQQGVVKQTYGFLSRYEALEGLKSESTAALKLSWLLRLLFIFVELFPALLKLFLPYSTYDAILEAHRRESVQLVHAMANQRMSGMANTQSPVFPSTPLLQQLNVTQPPAPVTAPQATPTQAKAPHTARTTP